MVRRSSVECYCLLVAATGYLFFERASCRPVAWLEVMGTGSIGFDVRLQGIEGWTDRWCDVLQVVARHSVYHCHLVEGRKVTIRRNIILHGVIIVSIANAT